MNALRPMLVCGLRLQLIGERALDEFTAVAATFGRRAFIGHRDAAFAPVDEEPFAVL